MTWNVNGIRSVVQKGFFDFLERENPDILGLQETKAHPDQLEDALVSPLGWSTCWSAAERAGYSGTALFCRQAPQSFANGFGIRQFDAEGRMVVAQYPQFVLFNVYFPNGGSGPERHQYKQEFLKYFGRHLKHLVQSGTEVIVMGDFNVAYLDSDVYDPQALKNESGFLPEERLWMEDLLKNGFIDTFRHFFPNDKHHYTWWAYYENARAGNRGWRIDHILVSEGLRPFLKSAKILDEQMGSDHCPAQVELEF